MPYTPAQCRKFAVMASSGEKPPADWKKHCEKGAKKKAKKHTSTKTKAGHNHG